MTLMTAKLKEGEQMLVGYVSDERYMAVPDCALLFEQGSKGGISVNVSALMYLTPVFQLQTFRIFSIVKFRMEHLA